MVYSREEAAKRAEAAVGSSVDIGICQIWTRNIFGANSVGDFDGDGRADAEDGWKQSTHKHAGDRNPPRGVPVSWSGGSRDDGHRAVSLGDGKIASTDAPRSGQVGIVDLDWFEENWGLTYLGWSEDISGVLIPKEEIKMSNYRHADKNAQWFQDNYPGSDLRLSPETMVVVIHTTEGISWPDYGGGATAPNYTGQPGIPKYKVPQWRAHFPDEKSSRALRNESGGVDTNTLNAVQLELIGTCDPKHSTSWNGEGRYLAGRDYVFWPKATKKQLRWVSRILADFHKRHGLKLVAPREFIAYPSSYGNSKVRLSGAQWRKTVGVVGHQHVPENSHGDPGNIDIDYILQEAEKMVAPKPKKPTRGKRVDRAIADLKASRGKGKRAELLKIALDALEDIEFLN